LGAIYLLEQCATQFNRPVLYLVISATLWVGLIVLLLTSVNVCALAQSNCTTRCYGSNERQVRYSDCGRDYRDGK
jgi:hypothetical protein